MQSSEVFWSQWKRWYILGSFTKSASNCNSVGSGGSSHRLWPAPQCLSVALKFNGRASNCPILYISLVGPLGPLFTLRTNSSICGKAPNCYLSQLSFWFLIHLCLKCILIFPEVHFWNFRSHFSFFKPSLRYSLADRAL